MGVTEGEGVDMTERPILFNDEMVRALVRDKDPKTQTRRVMKDAPIEHGRGWSRWWVDKMDCYFNSEQYICECPYGKPGDRLWVRECWAKHANAEDCVYPRGEGHTWGSPVYRATHSGMKPVCEGFTTWKPSIHMPRWASRITLEVTDVRVERVQDISEADAKAEGVQPVPFWEFTDEEMELLDYPLLERMKPIASAFSGVWDSINAKRGYGWEVNPWVWVVEFKQLASE